VWSREGVEALGQRRARAWDGGKHGNGAVRRGGEGSTGRLYKHASPGDGG
jgi:hypothetical protein